VPAWFLLARKVCPATTSRTKTIDGKAAQFVGSANEIVSTTTEGNKTTVVRDAWVEDPPETPLVPVRLTLTSDFVWVAMSSSTCAVDADQR
jgi:hypothetical protein